MRYLGVEEDFRSEESFVSHIHLEGLFGNIMNTCGVGDSEGYGEREGSLTFVGFDPLIEVGVVFVELFHDVGRDVTVTFLDSLSGFKRLFRGDTRLSFPEQLLNEVGDIPTSDGDVLDTATDHVSFSL